MGLKFGGQEESLYLLSNHVKFEGSRVQGFCGYSDLDVTVDGGRGVTGPQTPGTGRRDPLS